MAEEKTALMSKTQQFIFEQVDAWAKSISTSITGVTLSTTGRLDVDKSADTKDVEKLTKQLAASDNVSDKQGNLIEIALAALINEIAGREKLTVDEVIENLRIDEYTEKSVKTLRNYCKAQMQLKPEDYHYGLTITHYLTAIGFAGPEDGADMKKFIKGRSHLLSEAAEDPTARGKSFVSEGMKRLQEKFGVEKKNKTEKLSDITDRLISMLRIKREEDILPMIVADEGHRKDLMNHVNDMIEADITTLADKGKLNPVIDEVILDIVAQAPADLIIEAVSRNVTDGSDEIEEGSEEEVPQDSVDPLADPEAESDDEDESDWTDDDYTESLDEIGYEVEDTEDEFILTNRETGAVTTLESENLTDALFEAWGLVKP